MSQEQQLRERLQKQLMFNVVVAKMKKQGCPGSGLRGEDGTRNCIGWLITDSHYSPEFETLLPNAILMDRLDMPRLGYMFYDDLHQAHSASMYAKDWWPAFVEQMLKVATEHFLNPESLNAS